VGEGGHMGTVIATRSEMPARRSRAVTARRGRRRFVDRRQRPAMGLHHASRTMIRPNRGKARRTACQQHLSERARYAGSASPTPPSSSCISARITPGETAGPRGTTTTQPIPATRPGRPETAEAPRRLSSASSRHSRHTAGARAATNSSRRSHSTAAGQPASLAHQPPAYRQPPRHRHDPGARAAPVAIRVNQQIVSESIRFPLRPRPVRNPVPCAPGSAASHAQRHSPDETR
jgi:hypothetical protein